MRKGYTDGGPWHGNQVWVGLVLIHSYSESGRDIVIQVVHVCVRVGAEWRQSGSGRGRMEADEVGQKWSVEGFPGGVDKGETRGKRARGRSYHDITPLLCCYILEQCSSSSMLRAVRASSGSGGLWRIRVLEVEFLNRCWGVDLSVGEPHVI